MERMGDILAKNATRRVSQRRPPSEPTPTPAPVPPVSAPTSAAAPRQPSQPPARTQRPTMPPTLSRRVVPGRPRSAVRPGGSAPASSARPPIARARPDAAPETPATPSAAPAADALDSDRILELPRRSGLARRTGNVSQDVEPQMPSTPASSSSRSPALPDAIAEAGPARGARLTPRRPAVTSVTPVTPTRALTPLRELTQDYVARRPASSVASPRASAASRAARATTPPPVVVDPDVCSLCHGAGFVRLDVPVGDPSFGQAVLCSCKERQLEERHQSELRRLSSLDPFMDKTLETFDVSVPGVREAYEVARRYADDPQGWLVLMGGYGVGKTHLAAAIAHQRLDAGSPVFFSIVPDLLDHLRATFAPSAELRYDDMFDRIREAGLLILDDLGAENGTAWATEKLFQLINYRYNFRIPTVITTNHRLLSHMDERIRSRLSDISLVRHVTIEAGDYRDRHAGRAPRGSGGGTRSAGAPRSRGYSR